MRLWQRMVCIALPGLAVVMAGGLAYPGRATAAKQDYELPWTKRPEIVRWSSNGKYLAVAAANDLYLWDAQRWVLLRTLIVSPPAEYGVIQDVVWSPQSTTLAVATYSNGVQLWSVPDGVRRRTLTTDGNLAFSPDGLTLAVGRGTIRNPQANVVQLWRVRDGKLVRTLRRGLEHGAGYVAFAPDGITLAVGSAGKNLSTIDTWRIADGVLLRRRQGIDGYVNSLTYTPDKATLVVGFGGLNVHLLSARTLVPLRTLSTIGYTALSRDGRLLAVASDEDDTVELWRLPAGKLERTITVPNLGRFPGGVGWASDGEHFAAATNTVQIWRVSDGGLDQMLPDPLGVQ